MHFTKDKIVITLIVLSSIVEGCATQKTCPAYAPYNRTPKTKVYTPQKKTNKKTTYIPQLLKKGTETTQVSSRMSYTEADRLARQQTLQNLGGR